ncbi:hypothetical protein IGI04_040519 [Brassica rapa subsp. trilocularis]|uniref:Uncharacterized protein n=1 Tax=Brassica rapa subsp. trilocularis TaxID=1813537 RepID=A0ABQ7KN25_BRACM|nr:hypothetical protein IGI04_040519 [Brassica rapa subsp. trilocularis]
MELPKFLEELAGNEYLFSYVLLQIISPLTTVHSPSLQLVTTSGRSVPSPVVDLKSGQPTASASSTGNAANIALGNDETNQPSFAGNEKTRKCPCE